MESTKYINPSEAGLQSTHAAVARRLGKLLSVLGEEINEWCVEPGELTEDLRALRMKIHTRALEEGWRIRAKTGSGWKVLPPSK